MEFVFNYSAFSSIQSLSDFFLMNRNIGKCCVKFYHILQIFFAAAFGMSFYFLFYILTLNEPLAITFGICIFCCSCGLSRILLELFFSIELIRDHIQSQNIDDNL